MTDMRKTIAPKSDQLNSDDFIAGPMTIKITKVMLSGAAEQPICVHYEGDNGKPYKPCKSMRRVMVHVWGGDGNEYAGRSMTLFRDPSVKWGGEAVGGIRISHMSDMKERIEIALTATRGSRKPYVVNPLSVQAMKPPEMAISVEEMVKEGNEAAERGTAILQAFWLRFNKAQQTPVFGHLEGWKKRAAEIDAASANPDAAPF